MAVKQQIDEECQGGRLHLECRRPVTVNDSDVAKQGNVQSAHDNPLERRVKPTTAFTHYTNFGAAGFRRILSTGGSGSPPIHCCRLNEAQFSPGLAACASSQKPETYRGRGTQGEYRRAHERL